MAVVLRIIAVLFLRMRHEDPWHTLPGNHLSYATCEQEIGGDMRYLPLLILMSWGLLALLAGCGGNPENAAARELVARAPELIGPAESYRAEVRGLSSRHVDYVRLVGIAVKPDPNLVIDPLVLTLTDIRYQARPFQILNVGSANFTARISEAALNNYVRQQARPGFGNVSAVRVTLQRHTVIVSADVSLEAVTVPVTTSGQLQVGDGLHLNYLPQTLTVGNVGIPRTVQSILAGRVNPIIDLSGLRFSPRVTSITVNRGELLLAGTAELRGLP